MARSIRERIQAKRCPALHQAWNPCDQFLEEDFLTTVARHSMYWEEPVSQLSMGMKLALGAEWDHAYPGLGECFTEKSMMRATAARDRLLELNPNMIFLYEVRWRDAPGSYLPEDSPWWKRHENGERVLGWDGGPEPYYLFDGDHPGWQEHVAKQAMHVVNTGLFDGVMYDWRGNLEIIKKTREQFGDRYLILVNDNEDYLPEHAPYVNGSFMECTTADWDRIRDALVANETTFQEPRINCLEVWGTRDNVPRMRACTALGLTHSDGYLLYADPNPAPQPDHIHGWFDFWNHDLGKPLGGCEQREDGGYVREFEHATVVYNHQGNRVVKVRFPENRIKLSTGEIGTTFLVHDTDGEIFLKSKTTPYNFAAL